MKNFSLLLLFSLFTTLLYAQPGLSAEEWRVDLRHLQQTVHEKYDFLFKKVSQEEFDAEVQKLHEAIPELEEHEIIVGLARLVALFKYGHTAIHVSGWWEREAFNFNQAPLNLYHFSDGIYVQGVHKDYEQALGAKVLKVEGRPIEEALAAIQPVVSAENEQFFKAYGINLLGTPEVLHAQGVTKRLKETVTLTLQKEGNPFEVTFEPIKEKGFPGGYGLIKEQGEWLGFRETATPPLYLKNMNRIYYYEYLPEHKAVYVRHSQIQDDPQEAIPAFYERLFDFIEANEVEKLILDVRLNGGGNNYKNKPIVTGVIACEKINQPGNFFVIIGRRTFSACQNLVNELDNYTEAIFVGEPTAENINFYGDTRQEVLPNSKIPVNLSFAWWQDKPQWENADWTTPHLAVDMSFEEYRANQDPVLEAALNFSAEGFVLDPMEHLKAMFMAGQLEELEAEAKRMLEDPRYRYHDFEDEFNQAGYKLINDGQMEPALFVFGLNTRLFPESANAWDSLGEAHWKAGKIDKAIEYYNKAIKMDPDGWVGDNARAMLEEIKKEQKNKAATN